MASFSICRRAADLRDGKRSAAFEPTAQDLRYSFFARLSGIAIGGARHVRRSAQVHIRLRSV